MNFCPSCGDSLQETLIDSEIRKACSAEGCKYVLWNNPTPVVAIIVEVEAGVVLAHNRAWPQKFYSIITGFLESGEQPEECAIRETREELNLNVSNISLVGCYGFLEQNQVIIAYHAEATGEIKLNEELDDYKIVTLDELKPWDRGTGLAIRDWLASRKA